VAEKTTTSANQKGRLSGREKTKKKNKTFWTSSAMASCLAGEINTTKEKESPTKVKKGREKLMPREWGFSLCREPRIPASKRARWWAGFLQEKGGKKEWEDLRIGRAGGADLEDPLIIVRGGFLAATRGGEGIPDTEGRDRRGQTHAEKKKRVQLTARRRSLIGALPKEGERLSF